MKSFKSAVPVGDLGQYATMLVIIGITIGIGTLVLFAMDDTDAVSPITYYNDTAVSTTNNTYLILTQPRVIEIISAGNASSATGSPYGLGNFSTIMTNRSATSSSVYWSGWDGFTAGQTSWVYYTYYDDSATSDALMQASDSIAIFGDWLTIIAIVVVAVVVLSLIKYL